MNSTPLDVPCAHCRTRAGQPCLAPTGRHRPTPHAKRLRTWGSAIPHFPPGQRDGIPVAIPVELSPVHDRQGHRTMTVLCPLCWQQHRHGWDDHEDAEWTHRVEHCDGLIDTRQACGYWIPPTANLPRPIRTTTAEAPA